MIDSDEITAALEKIAQNFEQNYQDHELEGAGGWGQFLDGPRKDRQIGLYGTCAGLLVLSLAGRDDTQCTEGATKLLSNWWGDRVDGYGRLKFPQNPRLAFFSICLRNTPNETAKNIAAEIEDELLSRASTAGRWGDYWLKKEIRASGYPYFPTALAALSLGILNPPTEKASDCLKKAADFLNMTLATNSHLTSAEKGLIAAATLASSGSINHGGRKVIKVVARGNIDTLSENHTYFYEYQYANPATSAEPLWERDTVFLYSEIMLGIAGFLPGAPGDLRLRAEAILRRLLKNINAQGSFRPLHDGRLSTVEQAWCSVLLALARSDAPKKSGRLTKIRYALLRQRGPNIFTEIIFPAIAVVIVAAVSSLSINSLPFQVMKILAPLAIYGLYGEKVIRKVLPDRSR